MKKHYLAMSVFALASLAFGAGKSYNVTISKLSKAGSLQLVPGDYKLKVNGGKAVFTDAKHRDFSTAVKIENGSRKFPYTAIDSTESGATDQINSITLGGSKTKIEFGE